MRPSMEHGATENGACGISHASIPAHRSTPDAIENAGGQQPDRHHSDGGIEESFPPPLTRAEAAALSQRAGGVSVWAVVKLQALAGLGVALLAGVLAGEQQAFWSALWGAAVIVLPGAWMARGIGRGASGAQASAGVVRFLLLELVKIGLSVLLLVLAVKVLQPLHWPALLAGLVVCSKVYWLLLLKRRRRGG